jgi:hypothetical protein
LVPDIKLDFSNVTYSSVLEIIAPIVPGAILAVGTLVLNPSLAAKLLSNPYLGYRSRLAASVFISYAAGLLLSRSLPSRVQIRTNLFLDLHSREKRQ